MTAREVPRWWIYILEKRGHEAFARLILWKQKFNKNNNNNIKNDSTLCLRYKETPLEALQDMDGNLYVEQIYLLYRIKSF